MSRPTPRRPSSSRAATPRPRKIAGGPPPRAEEQPEQPEATEPDVPDEPPPPAEDWPVEDPEDGADGERSVLHSPRLTRILLAVAAVLALVLVVEAAWWVFRDDDDGPTITETAKGSIAVPSDRPVLPNQVAWQAGVDAAAKAAEKIVNRTFQKYDEEVDAATALMTPEFAEEYRKTTDDVRDQFIARKTTVQVRVRAQGVVRANDTELQALLFIDQFVGRNKGKDPKTSITGYRALLTMVNTDEGWLVDDLQTE